MYNLLKLSLVLYHVVILISIGNFCTIGIELWVNEWYNIIRIICTMGIVGYNEKGINKLF